MKKLLCLGVILLAFIPARGSAQSLQQTWGPVTGTGPLGTARNYRVYGVVPSNYTIDWFNDGTAAAVCTYRIVGSSDGKHFHPLTPILGCVNYDELGDGGSSSMTHVALKPLMYIQVQILSFTAGDNTTVVNFNYTRGTAQ